MTTVADGVMFMDEGDVLVCGTLDPGEAIRLYVEADDGTLASYAGPDASELDVGWLAEHLDQMARCARPGYYRQAPPGPDAVAEEFDWELHPAVQGAGAFPAVYFPVR